VRQGRVIGRVMPPRCAVECADATSVGPDTGLIVRNSDQSIARPPGDIANICAGHPGIALIVNGPACAIEPH
jgi:hypothetical protein